MQWKVEALEPDKLQRLVLAAANPYIDRAVLARQVAREEEQRRALARSRGARGAMPGPVLRRRTRAARSPTPPCAPARPPSPKAMTPSTSSPPPPPAARARPRSTPHRPRPRSPKRTASRRRDRRSRHSGAGVWPSWRAVKGLPGRREGAGRAGAASPADAGSASAGLTPAGRARGEGSCRRTPGGRAVVGRAGLRSGVLWWMV